MRVFTSYSDVPVDLIGSALALGNFDGVHVGHQAVIGTAKQIADKEKVPSVVMSFSPHPRRYFRPDDPCFELTPGVFKARPIAQLGIDALFSIPFDSHLAGMAAENFIEQVLVSELRISHVVAGYDFVFGKGRQGNLALLEKMGKKYGFGTSIVDAVHPKNKDLPPISSTLIRKYLRAGRVKDASRLLGRNWEIEGEVVAGEQRGGKIGFPTANISLGNFLHPAFGVYACWVAVCDGEKSELRKGVVNIGRRPTFDGEGVTVEAHLFDFDANLYGKVLRVILASFIRPEVTFDGIDEIRTQITKDCSEALSILNANSTPYIDLDSGVVFNE
ncbi:MAG: riboflavin biosynthesis protein RibF [Rhodospirillaceae bacterium]|nr:riboflavin biosynthesis protein RibF [Rhodospirillaceae bacterium]|tara:strand:- start:918 stop:1910 length:993 start_codon:yes stop_codon:yes gene_type:complete